MARRSSLTTTDLEVIEGALTEKINGLMSAAVGRNSASASGEPLTVVDKVAPLFAVREKIIAMSKTNGASSARKVGRPRGSKNAATELTEA